MAPCMSHKLYIASSVIAGTEYLRIFRLCCSCPVSMLWKIKNTGCGTFHLSFYSILVEREIIPIVGSYCCGGQRPCLVVGDVSGSGVGQ